MDILAISCDSFDEQVNVLIGRGQGKKNHVENLQKLRKWCRDYKVAFKINSVINRFNVDEDMNEHIKALSPVRWKVSPAEHARLYATNTLEKLGPVTLKTRILGILEFSSQDLGSSLCLAYTLLFLVSYSVGKTLK